MAMLLGIRHLKRLKSASKLHHSTQTVQHDQMCPSAALWLGSVSSFSTVYITLLHIDPSDNKQ